LNTQQQRVNELEQELARPNRFDRVEDRRVNRDDSPEQPFLTPPEYPPVSRSVQTSPVRENLLEGSASSSRQENVSITNQQTNSSEQGSSSNQSRAESPNSRLRTFIFDTVRDAFQQINNRRAPSPPRPQITANPQELLNEMLSQYERLRGRLERQIQELQRQLTNQQGQARVRLNQTILNYQNLLNETITQYERLDNQRQNRIQNLENSSQLLQRQAQEQLSQTVGNYQTLLNETVSRYERLENQLRNQNQNSGASSNAQQSNNNENTEPLLTQTRQRSRSRERFDALVNTVVDRLQGLWRQDFQTLDNSIQETLGLYGENTQSRPRENTRRSSSLTRIFRNRSTSRNREQSSN
jgi:hypothetical protein